MEGTTHFRLVEDVVIELLQDPRMKDEITYQAKQIFQGNKRVFGPLSSGKFWEELEVKFPDKTIILLIIYSDATEFYKGVSAHPVFGKMCTVLCTEYTYLTTCWCLLTATLGNIKETTRFKNVAWRLLNMIPPNLKELESTIDKVKLWHLSVGQSFKNYNKTLQEGIHIECSDGTTRNCVIVAAQHQADQPEADSICCCVQVRVLCTQQQIESIVCIIVCIWYFVSQTVWFLL